jgi:hypothetical protein
VRPEDRRAPFHRSLANPVAPIVGETSADTKAARSCESPALRRPEKIAKLVDFSRKVLPVTSSEARPR